jgi:hypothetical protein
MSDQLQLTMFGIVKQPRLTRREPLEVYLAVLALRRRRKSVYRHGRHQHLVNGKHTVSDAELMLMARRAAS